MAESTAWGGRFHVVLAEPEDNLNIGAVARAMTNLGFEHLHLAAPRGWNIEEAARTACHARHILENAKLHHTLDESLAPMQDVIGFTARESRHRRMHVTLPEWSGTLGAAGGSADVALLFGPESTGLHNEHITRCRLLVRIPSAAANPSFNLAQAVLLVLFEISRRAWEPEPDARDLATANELLQLDRLVKEVLTAADFYRPDSPPPVEAIISNLLRRTQPDRREIGILLALFNHLHTTLMRPA